MKILKLASVLLAAFAASSAFSQIIASSDIKIETTPNGRPGDISGGADEIDVTGANFVNLEGTILAGRSYNTSGTHLDTAAFQILWSDGSTDTIATITEFTGNGSSSSLFSVNGIDITPFQDSPGGVFIQTSIAVPSGVTSATLLANGSVSSWEVEGISMTGTFKSSVSAIPEPSTYAAILGALAIGGLGVRRMRRRKQVQG